jgi:hypothetical protein
MNGLSIRVLDICESDAHEKEFFFSTKSIFEGLLDSRLAMAVANCAAPKPTHTRS